jgi:hypothetical protein
MFAQRHCRAPLCVAYAAYEAIELSFLFFYVLAAEVELKLQLAASEACNVRSGSATLPSRLHLDRPPCQQKATLKRQEIKQSVRKLLGDAQLKICNCALSNCTEAHLQLIVFAGLHNKLRFTRRYSVHAERELE